MVGENESMVKEVEIIFWRPKPLSAIRAVIFRLEAFSFNT
jgi:hypothetical protein